ncbi:protein kinase domain-containing protein [Streptomyces sp. CA-249302]|uniref:serine/threonine-protein kinase n=1 Tax=Streptomyces sp. CA-249302 TaxID=3240058 RepID=UPI003D92FACA
MGRVWRAADEMLDRPVAVKEMRIDGLDAEDTRTRRERTLREARATARIDHPNVVRVYDVVDEGERLWIVMELVNGRSLERIMVEDGALGSRETARIGLGLVAALRQVHARGVLHRDIKPGNVLVEGAGELGERIVLTDFGIAAIQDAKALTMVGMLVGSPDYMAPERVSGRPQGPPSDIWSLGATLCAALGGRSPFSRDTTLATLHAVLYEEPEIPPAAGPLGEVLAALLEKEPEVRPGLPDLEEALRPIAFPASTPTLPVGGGEVAEAEEEEPVEAGGVDAEREADLAPESAGDVESEPSVPAYAVVLEKRSAEPAPGAPEATEVPQELQELQEVQEPEEPPEPEDTPAPPEDARPTPPTPWTPNESPTPAYVDTRFVRAVRDPRQPEPVEDAPPPDQTDTHDFGHRTLPTPYPRRTGDRTPPAAELPSPTGNRTPPAGELPAPTPSASTEVPSELRPDVRSETPSAPAPHSASSAPPTVKRAGVSLIRAQAAMTQRPAHPNGADHERRTRPALGSHPLRTPEHERELPGPPVPAEPRRDRRRIGVFAGAGVAAVAAVVVVLLLANSGSPGDDKAAGSSTSPSTSATSPSPTVEGTTRPRTLPPGTHEEAGGYAWATPKGWTRNVKTGAEVHYTSPDTAQELVAKSSVARGDLVKTWEQSEQNAHQGKDYRKIRFEQTTFQGNPAVVWEYTVTVNDVPWHARLLGFNQAGRSYQVNIWYHPDVEAQAVKTYDKVKDSFTVL